MALPHPYHYNFSIYNNNNLEHIKLNSLISSDTKIELHNNENLNLPSVYTMIDIKTHFLNKFKPIISADTISPALVPSLK